LKEEEEEEEEEEEVYATVRSRAITGIVQLVPPLEVLKIKIRVQTKDQNSICNFLGTFDFTFVHKAHYKTY
jgi:hypothetical protein